MNGIWGGMLLVGIIYGVMTGRTEAVSAAVLDSSRDAVTLCITMPVSYTHLTLPTTPYV